ncbi:galactokinase [Spirochaetia bacterium]|nr:galactokinase [Spirochaetia bacterium]
MTGIEQLNTDKTEKLFARIYGEDNIGEQKKRWADLIQKFYKRWGNKKNIRLFSSPGRSEICGNHTDHNNGKTLGASIQLDCIAVVIPSSDNKIYITDYSYNKDFQIDLNKDLREESGGTKDSRALLCGIAQGFTNAGFNISGFKGCFTSSVIPAAGVSSSAAFEMLVCGIINNLYNGGSIQIEKMAAIGQYAENNYWGKKSGMLDQMACAAGGLAAFDFENPASPRIEKIPFDFAAQKYRIILVNSGNGHADLTEEYSSIPNEMKQVAGFFGKDALRGIPLETIVNNLSAIRAQCGDRAALRSLHFIMENERVLAQIEALKKNDFLRFLSLITESGNSSWKWLQNVYVPQAKAVHQSVSVNLALTEIFIKNNCAGGTAACRIHGGGFAGVIQTFLPENFVDCYTAWMQNALKPAAVETPAAKVFSMSVRPEGLVEIDF